MLGHHWRALRRSGWHCRQCGRTVHKESQLATACPGPAPAGRLRRGGRWAAAVARWVAAGSPTRGPELVRHIYRERCWPCTAFDTHNEICSICSCKVQESGLPIRNKIAMATEHCPRRIW